MRCVQSFGFLYGTPFIIVLTCASFLEELELAHEVPCVSLYRKRGRVKENTLLLLLDITLDGRLMYFYV